MNPKVSLFRPKLGDEQVRCWKNMEIKEGFIKDIQDIQEMRTSSIASVRETCIKGSQNSLDKLDMDSSSEKSNKNTSDRIYRTLKQLENIGEKSTAVQCNILLDRLEIELSMDREKIEEKVEDMKSGGDIFEPKPGKLKTL